MSERNPVDENKTDEVAEQRLRKSLLDRAPQASATHDTVILAAAHAAAAKTREAKKTDKPSWPIVAAALAASVLVALSLWQLSTTPTVTSDMTLRSSENQEVLPNDNATLDATPIDFRWLAQSGARRYQFSLRNDSADLLWTSRWVDTPNVVLPAAARELLANDARYFWVVEIDGNGPRQSLGPYWFRIRE